jgi:hypothetical protein
MPQIAENIFTKFGPADVLRREMERTQRAHEIGARSGLFHTPRATRLDDQHGTLEMEYVPGLKQLSGLAIERDERFASIVETAGRALALVHKDLLLPQREPILGASMRVGPGDGVFVHGDFNTNNVAYSDEMGRLVILDWSTAPILNGEGNFGSRYFDLVWFSFDLIQVGAIGRFRRAWGEGMAKTFHRGYVSACGVFDARQFLLAAGDVEPALMRAACACLRAHRGLRAVIERVKHRFVWHRWRAFKGSCKG